MAVPATPFAGYSTTFEQDTFSSKVSMWDRVKKFGNTFLTKEDNEACAEQGPDDFNLLRAGVGRRLSRRVIPGLPRPGTFKRQESERRDNLQEHLLVSQERRAVSAGRRRAVSSARQRPSSTPPRAAPSLSAPEVGSIDDGYLKPRENKLNGIPITDVLEVVEEPEDFSAPQSPPGDDLDQDVLPPETEEDEQIREELEQRWILNLSMHFRDRSDREKFFVTYLDTFGEKDCWRRITISCDYRNAPPDSLELDLKGLPYQRVKSARIYAAIRESLPDIQFYNTVTNLKLVTSDGRLHVHVTEDAPELIRYPPVSAIGHLHCKRYRESSLKFDSHLSGFVYKVEVNRQTFIKKEIPGPDAVEEFLYEINALHALCGSNSVIHFGGVVLDDEERCVKGLLISYADQGALVDILYDEKGKLAWKRRERWAKQIVEGLSEIHETGFVQGDFTLSNIVVDGKDNAKIIDINRRGCPVGWEPPEVGALIDSGQRISMYIGVKSDLFQLGMVLWALAEEIDEPETQPRPLSLNQSEKEIPEYFRRLVDICLSDQPQGRLSAKTLLSHFPEIDEMESRPMIEPHESISNPSDKQYIDPAAAVEREDIERFRQRDSSQPIPEDRRSTGEATYVEPTTTATDISDVYVVPRGRTGVHREKKFSSLGKDVEDLEPQILAVSPGDEKKWEEVEVDGNPFLVHTGHRQFKEPGFDDEEKDTVDLPGGPSSPEGFSQLEPVMTALSDGAIDDFRGIGACHIPVTHEP
jgi:serine/threonine protein kinase